MFKQRQGGITYFGNHYPTGLIGGYSTGFRPVMGTTCPDDVERLLKTGFFTRLSTLRVSPNVWQSMYPASESLSCTEFRPPVWNDCSHQKINANFNLPYGYIIKGYWPWPGYLPKNCVHEGCTRKFTAFTPLHTSVVPGGIEIDQFFRSRAMATMTPSFESDFKALNFLFELKDFKDVGRGLLDVLNPRSPLWGAVGSWNRRWGAQLQNGKVDPRDAKKPDPTGRTTAEVYAGNATSLAAKSWLTYTMAYLPLMKDIAAFGAALAAEYQQALSDFRKKGLTLNSRHYSEYLMNQNKYYPNGSSGSGPEEGRCKLYNIKATANIQYSYKYTLSDQSEAFARYWGLTGTAEEFWNMLPFSFLVDYFLQISKALSQLERDKNLTLEPVQYCESLKCTTGTDFVVRNDDYLCGLIVDGTVHLNDDRRWYPIQGISSSNYTRRVTDVPKIGLIVPRMKLPSLRQQQNIVALARVLLF